MARLVLKTKSCTAYKRTHIKFVLINGPQLDAYAVPPSAEQKLHILFAERCQVTAAKMNDAKWVKTSQRGITPTIRARPLTFVNVNN